jgi:hypothetical protein
MSQAPASSAGLADAVGQGGVLLLLQPLQLGQFEGHPPRQAGLDRALGADLVDELMELRVGLGLQVVGQDDLGAEAVLQRIAPGLLLALAGLDAPFERIAAIGGELRFGDHRGVSSTVDERSGRHRPLSRILSLRSRNGYRKLEKNGDSKVRAPKMDNAGPVSSTVDPVHVPESAKIPVRTGRRHR